MVRDLEDSSFRFSFLLIEWFFFGFVYYMYNEGVGLFGNIKLLIFGLNLICSCVFFGS